jgi:hypothetical protein
MPVEESSQAEFDFEYGEEFGRHIDEFDPRCPASTASPWAGRCGKNPSAT